MKKDDDELCKDFEALVKEYPMFQYYYNLLIQNYPNKSSLTPTQTRFELDIKDGTYYNRKRNGVGLPHYNVDGNGKNARIYFPLVCVAAFRAKNFIRGH